MKPITKIYCYKNIKTGELVGKLFVKKPTSELYSIYQRSNGIYKLVECEIVEKESCYNCHNYKNEDINNCQGDFLNICHEYTKIKW